MAVDILLCLTVTCWGQLCKPVPGKQAGPDHVMELLTACNKGMSSTVGAVKAALGVFTYTQKC